MKLAKRISKGIALCATLVIIGWGGVMTSCSNGSDDPEEQKPPVTDNDNNQTDGEGEGTTPPVTDNDNSQTGGDNGTPPESNIPQGAVTVKFGDIGTYEGQGGTTKYTTSKDKDDIAVTISHSGLMAQYANCSLKVTELNKYNTVVCNLKNEGTVDAIVQFAIQKAGTESNNWSPTSATITGTVDNDEPNEGAGDWGVKTKIAAGKTQNVSIKFDPSKNPDEIAVQLNSGDKENKTNSGNITISDAYMWQE